MKILYITNNDDLDYLNNSVFHGLVSLFKNDIIDSNFVWYMSDCEYTNNIGISHLYGKGFTFGKTLYDRSQLDRSNILDKISDHYFDIVIYGSVWRNLDYIDEVVNHYNTNEIIYLDGEDDERIRFDVNKGLYFKRELSKFFPNQITPVFPISFSIPNSKFKIINYNKTVEVFDSFTNENHSFDNEEDYYNSMNNAFFATTKIKGGWDCLRHYEIIAAACLPFFERFEYMSKLNMFNWPIDLQYQANIYHYHMCFGLNEDYNRHYYFKLLNEFHQYALNHLTTIQSAEYILSKL